MPSIKQKLVKTTTVIISIILFIVFIIIDLSVDDWVDKQFDISLINKANYLKNLVKVTDQGVEFDFSGEFMPEFERQTEAEYFQLWKEDLIFERSTSLANYTNKDLIMVALPLGSSKIFSVYLPDGRSGEAVVTHFQPKNSVNKGAEFSNDPQSMFLTVAISSEGLSKVANVIDITLLFSFMLIIIGMRYLIVKSIEKGLAPLSKLNAELKTFDITNTKSQLEIIENEDIEIAPIRDELNIFIKSNQQLMKNEKRLSADIAHELKTPIAEIISLSEIYIRYPEEQQIAATYKQDMLAIALKMKNIINNLLLLQDSSSGKGNLQLVELKLPSFVNTLLDELSGKYAEINERVRIEDNLQTNRIAADEFCLRTILTNLLDNALFYSPVGSIVSVHLVTPADNSIHVIIENEVINELHADDIKDLLKPLFQVDKSRTDSDRHGLGLTIVDKLCQLNNYNLGVTYMEPKRISFDLKLG